MVTTLLLPLVLVLVKSIIQAIRFDQRGSAPHTFPLDTHPIQSHKLVPLTVHHSYHKGTFSYLYNHLPSDHKPLF